VSGLPQAAIIELETIGSLASRLPEKHFRNRFLEISRLNGATVVLNENLDPVAPGATGQPEITIGGPTEECKGSGGGVGISQSLADQIKDTIDPEKCPQCGAFPDPGASHVINVRGDDLLNIQVGQELLSQINRNRSVVNRMPALTRTPELARLPPQR
jgi:hypothetical protein